MMFQPSKIEKPGVARRFFTKENNLLPMRPSSKKIALYCLGFLLAYPTWSQTAPTKVDVAHFSVEQGLSDRSVNFMAKDNQGFLWIATDNGLNRFDGYTFLQYDCRPRSKHKIRYNRVYAVLPDRTGNLLIGYDYPQNGALDWLTPLTGRVTQFSFTQGTGFPGAYHSFFRAADGSLYFLVLQKDHASIYAFEEKTQQFLQVFEATHPGIDFNCYAAFLKAADGTFWIAYNWEDKGPFLVHADAAGRTLRWYTGADFSLPPGSGGNQVALTEVANGDIWFTLQPHGVYVLNRGDGAVISRHPQLPPAGYYFAKDKKGNLLAYQTEPADPAKGAYLLLANGQLANYSWLFEHQEMVGAVCSDDFTAGLLAGTGNGFNSYQLRPERFKTFLGKDLGVAPYGISTRGMAKSGKDKLLIATERDGLFELDLKTNAVSRTGDRLPQLAPLNKIQYPRNLLSQGDSIIWIPCMEGVVKYTPAQNTLAVYKSGFKEVSAITFGKDGKLWMALRDNRLAQLNTVSGDMTVYQNKDGSQPLENSQPSCLLTGRDGTIWIGTAVSGLIKISPDSGESQHFTANPGDPAGFNSNHITCIQEDAKGVLWVGTMESGLHVFDPVKGKVVAIYSRESGLRNNSTVGILPDNKGNYWVSTFNGLSYFDTTLKTFRNYTTADGLSHNEFNRHSCFFDKDYNRFYFGGMNGINAFDQKDPQPAINDAPLLITELVYAGGKDSMIVQHEGIVNGSCLTLAPGSRFLHLSLALGTYCNPGSNQFSYKIEGLDKDWNYLGANRDLRIDYLPAGTYILHLRGADNRGNWSSREIALQLVVLEFWYKRWWAYGIYACLIVAAGVYFYRFQLRRRIAEKEAQRLQQLDIFKSQFFTNIAHEFRTPLTVILGTTAHLIDENSGAKSRLQSPLRLIKRNGEGLLRLINQILDLAKIERNTLQFNYVQGDVLPYLRYLCESLHSMARMQNVQLTVVAREPEIVLDYDPERLLQIVHNLLSNALKFTPAGGAVTLLAELLPPGSGGLTTSTTFKITVSDTGMGIAPQDLPHIFDRFYQADHLRKASYGGTGIGLALTKELVQLMGGDIRATSELNAGTSFIVSWPITRNAPRIDREFGEVGLDREPLGQPAYSSFSDSPVSPALALPSLLLIEDNPDVVAFLTATLQNKYHLDFAYNGKTGIERALESVPDLILSDVMMPEKDGFDVCETLKNDLRTSHIPLVLLTARADLESRIVGLRRGADAYMPKPFRREELLLTLNNLLHTRQALQARFDKQALTTAVTTQKADTGETADSFEQEDVFVQKLRQYVLDNLGKTDLSVDDLSRAMTMSYQNLHRKLSVLTNLSPTQFIRLLRLARARVLLQTTNRSVSDIAYAVGFNDAKYFSRVFTEEYGKSPSAERSGQI